MIQTENINEARKQIDKLSKEGKQVVVQGSSIEFNRLILENKRVNMLILSHTNKKDKLKQKDSGLNHVLCNITKENNIVLAFDMNELKVEDKKLKASMLARWQQNIDLIKKSKCKIKLINGNSNSFYFLLTLGLPTDLAKEAVS